MVLLPVLTVDVKFFFTENECEHDCTWVVEIPALQWYLDVCETGLIPLKLLHGVMAVDRLEVSIGRSPFILTCLLFEEVPSLECLQRPVNTGCHLPYLLCLLSKAHELSIFVWAKDSSAKIDV